MSRISISDWSLSRTLGDAIYLGRGFAFLSAELGKRPGFGWLAGLLGGAARPRVLSLLGPSPAELPGATVRSLPLPPLPLAVVTSDKALYREGRDEVRLLVVDPLSPGGEATLLVKLGGAELSQLPLRLGAQGAEVVTLRDLTAGDYEIRLKGAPADDPACRFTVAEYRLAPLVASLRDRRLEGARLSVTLSLETFGAPVDGEVDIELVEAGRRLDSARVAAAAGVARAALNLSGEGPHALNVSLVADRSRTATVPIVGSRAAERSQTIFSLLGDEVSGSLLPTPEARPVRGIFLEEGARRTSPFRLERVDARRARLIALGDAEAVVVAAVDPTYPRRRAGALDPATAAHPQHQDARYQEAERLFNAGRFAEARAIFEEARAAQPNPHPYYAYYSACCSARLGDLGKAVASLRLAIEDGWSDRDHLATDDDLAALRGFRPYEALTRGWYSEVSVDSVKAGAAVEIDMPAPAGLLAVGAFIGGAPWEGWAATLAPEELSPTIALPPRITPGDELEVAVELGRADPASVYLIVKDARLLSADTPQSRLAGQIKRAVEAAGKELTTGNPTTRLSEVVPPPAPPPYMPAPGMLPMAGAVPTGMAPPSPAFGGRSPAPVRRAVMDEVTRGASAPRMASAPPAMPKPAAAPARPQSAARMPPPPAASDLFEGGFGAAEEEYEAAYQDDATGSGAIPEELPLEAAAPAPPRRAPRAEPPPRAAAREPEVLFAGLVEARGGRAAVKVALGEEFADYVVEAFALSGLDWSYAEARFSAAKDPFVSLDLPAFVHPADAAVGRVIAGAAGGKMRLRVTRDGADVPLLYDEKPLPGEVDARRVEASFLAGPGRYAAVVEDVSRGISDSAYKEVETPGKLRRLSRALRFLQPGEELDRRRDPQITQLRVLPGLERPFRVLLDATADYGHACCEQTAAKMMSACAMFALADEGDVERRRRAEAVLIAGVRREQLMWLRGRGFKMYPESSNEPHSYYGPKAARYLQNLALLKALGPSKALSQAIDEALAMADDATRAYRLPWPPDNAQSCEEAYAVVKFNRDPKARARALALVEQRLAAPQMPPTPYLSGAVLERSERAYAAAALLATGGDIRRALALANAVVKDLGDNGRLYSTVDSVAAIALMSELRAAKIVGGAEVVVDGRPMPSAEAVALAEISKVAAQKGVAAVEVTRVVDEDWEKLAAQIPVRVALEKDGRAARRFAVGDAVTLRVTLEGGYKDGDLLWVCLPDCLSRIVGGGQVKRFSVDFSGRAELAVLLAATAPTIDKLGAPGPQRFAVCVRNMFEEERAGNPGLLEVTVGPAGDPSGSLLGRLLGGLRGLLSRPV